MRRLTYSMIASILILSSLLVGCAQSSPSPTATVTATATPTAPSTPRPSNVPTATPTGAPQYGGIVKSGRATGSRSFVVWGLVTGVGDIVPVYETLLSQDVNGTLQPWLATDWKLAADSKSLTLTLRKGVKFHDGSDFNAAAVKYNIEQRQKAKVGDYAEVTSIDMTDDYTVRLNVSSFSNTLLVTFRFLGGMMESPTAYQTMGVDKAATNPVGTGPFKLLSFEPLASVKYGRFDGYWQQGKPYLDGFEYYYIADSTTRSLSFQRGELDVLTAVEPFEINSLGQKGYTTVPAAPTNMVLIPDSANADSPLSKQKVREAIETAIDRPGVVKALGYGMYTNTEQVSTVNNYSYIPALVGRRAYSPEKAKQLLTEAGYPNGFKTTIYYLNSGSGDPSVAVAGYLKAVGIDALVTPVASSTNTQMSQGGWQNGLLTAPLLTVPDWLLDKNNKFSTTSIENKSLARPTGWQEQLLKAFAAPDEASKKAEAQKLNQMISDNAMMVPLWQYSQGNAFQKNVNNPVTELAAQRIWSTADTWKAK